MERHEGPQPAGEACIPNIAERGRRRRLRGGLVWLLVAMALTVAAIQVAASAAAFALLFLVYFRAALGYFQAREKT
jgi:hypothetical protein